MPYRYTLQPYKGPQTRYTCPCCNKPKIFCRYIDTETGQHLNPDVGRCNREINCGYHYTPKQYFADNGRPVDGQQTTDDRRQKNAKQSAVSTVVCGPSSIDPQIFQQSITNKLPNHFTNYLASIFGHAVTEQLKKRYHIGTAKHWVGASVFWQVDACNQIRTGKVMLYNPITGKRFKKPYNHITWAHTLLKLPDFNLQQCLFGEHLLLNNTQPVAIAESEKTAIIASVYLPDFIWLATGSLTNLTPQKCQVLKGRHVHLFPDLNAFDKWSYQAEQLTHCASVTVSDLLEKNATDKQREEGLDLGDYLVGEQERLLKK
jgi:Domain of unknown function (DUF6371)